MIAHPFVFRRAPLAVAAACLIARAAGAQNLVGNGGFELPALAGSGDAYSTITGAAIPDWTVATGASRVFLEYGTPAGVQRTCQGRQSLFLNSDGEQATSANPALGSWAYQDLATTIGKTYSLTFMAGDEQSGAPLTGPPGSTTSPASLRVSVGAGLNALTHTVMLGTLTRPCGTFGFDFTAGASVTRLRFDDLTSRQFANNSPFIDGISVVAVGGPSVAPEPATLALLAPGLGVLGWQRRRARGRRQSRRSGAY
ncbi:MAG TPA: DUF642 domain-containing protein [Gemmatirosa sp.]